MLNYFKLLITIFTYTALINSTANAQEVIKIFGNQFKPYKSYIDNGEQVGILIDILKYVEKDLNVKFEIQLSPWARAYERAERGLGGIIGFSKTKDRIRIFDYSDVMFFDDLYIVTLKSNIFEFDSMKDLKGKLIGSVRNASYGPEFEKAIKDKYLKIVEATKIQDLLVMLINKRIDGVIIGPGKSSICNHIGDNELLKNNKRKLFFLKRPFVKDPNYLGFRKNIKMLSFIKKFNESLQKIKSTHKDLEIYSKYPLDMNCLQ